jgi:hypothetical protein
MGGLMLAHHGWIFIVVGLLLATLVSFAIPYAARRSENRQPQPR